MAWSPKTAIALAALASFALHGAVFWFFHTPARGMRSVKVQRHGPTREVPILYESVTPKSATATPTTQRPLLSAPQPRVPEETQPPPKLEDEAKAESLNPGDYIPSTLLDVEPTVIQDIPNDPPELLGRTETGTMILTLLIGVSGAVDEVIVESSDLPEVFAEVARRDFLGARFNPGVRNGQAVPSTMRVEVTIGPGLQP